MVIPTYNEADNVIRVIDQVRVVVQEADILLVDDNSPYGTAGRSAGTSKMSGAIVAEALSRVLLWCWRELTHPTRRADFVVEGENCDSSKTGHDGSHRRVAA